MNIYFPIGNIRHSSDEDLYAIMHFNINKEIGPDGISAIILKHCAQSLAISLCSVSLPNGQIPNGKRPLLNLYSSLVRRKQYRGVYCLDRS